MDFNALLAVANKNNQMNDKLVVKQKSGFSTNVAPAKRLIKVKPKGVLSDSVKAFLDKKDREEKAKQLEAQKKKEGLLQLRKDVKTTRKATAMAKRTKDNVHKLEDMTEEDRDEKERHERQKLEEKRLAMIEKLKESEQKSTKRNRSATSVSTTTSEPTLSNKQLLADKKLMAKFDQDISDDECDVKLEVILGDKQILDKDGYQEREEARRKELKKQYGGRSVPVDLKAGKRLKPRTSLKRAEKMGMAKERHKLKDKHKHKSKHKHKDKSHKHKSKDNEEAPKERKPFKPKFIRPKNNKNALSFADLLKLANKRHDEVLKPDEDTKKDPAKIPEKKPPTDVRPMTQHEKDRIARKNTQEYKDWLKTGGELKIDKSKYRHRSLSPSSSDSESPVPAPKPVHTNTNTSSKTHQDGHNKSDRYEHPSKTHQDRHNKSDRYEHPSKTHQDRHSKSDRYEHPSKTHQDRHNKSDRYEHPSKTHLDRHNKSDRNEHPVKNGDFADSKPTINPQQSRPKHSLESTHINSDSSRDRPRPQTKRPGLSSVPSRTPKPVMQVSDESKAGLSRPGSGVSSKSSPPQGEKRNANGVLRKDVETHSNPFDRIMGQIKKTNPKPVKKNRVIESDSEYDSELDEFIDDDNDGFIDDSGAGDYSAEIRNIFGYDRRKYRNEDESDLRGMDTGFAETLKEEAISAKIGRMEDLADMKAEEEGLKRKMMKKKMKLKGR